MGEVSFLFADDSYEVAQILDNKTIIVFANRIDINSGNGSIFLMSLNIEDSDDGVIRGHLSPFTTSINSARNLSSGLNNYLNVETNKRRWNPEIYNPNTSVAAKFSAIKIEQNDQSSGYGVVWQGISTPGWSTANIWDSTYKTSTVIAIRLNEFFDFFRKKPNLFIINGNKIYSEHQVLSFVGR